MKTQVKTMNQKEGDPPFPINKRYIGIIASVKKKSHGCYKVTFSDDNFFCAGEIENDILSRMKRATDENEKISMELSVYPPCSGMGNHITAIKNAS